MVRYLIVFENMVPRAQNGSLPDNVNTNQQEARTWFAMIDWYIREKHVSSLTDTSMTFPIHDYRRRFAGE